MAQTAERRVIFVIPARNEERNIGRLLDATIAWMGRGGRPYRILVVDDGSTDQTAEVVRNFQAQAPVTLLSQGANLGVGEAFKRGFAEALVDLSDDDIVVTKEADNTSDLGVLEAMLSKIDGGYDLALASCYAKGGGVVGTTLGRRLLSGGANLLLRIVCPVDGVRTYSSFYRATRGKLLKEAHACYDGWLFEEKGFACMVDLLLKFHAVSPRVAEVPMILQCGRRLDESKMKRLETIRAYLVLMSRHLWRRFTGSAPWKRSRG